MGKADIASLDSLYISWNYGDDMVTSLKRTDPICIDKENEEDCISLSLTEAKWLSEELIKVIEKVDRYDLYLELKREFEGGK